MPADLTFLTASTEPAHPCINACAQTANLHGFSIRIMNISALTPAELLGGGKFLFFLGNQTGHDAIPFWLHLNSLNQGSLKNFQFAVCALVDSAEKQCCAFGNACNVKLAQLGGNRLHSLITTDGRGESSLDEWIRSMLAKLSSSKAPQWESLAA